jgi:hypothetical protein
MLLGLLVLLVSAAGYALRRARAGERRTDTGAPRDVNDDGLWQEEPSSVAARASSVPGDALTAAVPMSSRGSAAMDAATRPVTTVPDSPTMGERTAPRWGWSEVDAAATRIEGGDDGGKRP